MPTAYQINHYWREDSQIKWHESPQPQLEASHEYNLKNHQHFPKMHLLDALKPGWTLRHSIVLVDESKPALDCY